MERWVDKQVASRAPHGATHTFFIRDEKRGDEEVINEVFSGDTYQVSGMQEPETIFDIGGHIGTFTCSVALRFPNARIWVIEPHPRSFDLLVKNTQNLPNVTPIHGAVSYSRGGILADGQRATGGGYMTTRERYEREGNKELYALLGDVPTYTVEDLFEIAGIESVDLVKWDCEGGEIDAFRNMPDEVAGRIGNMVGEYHIAGGYRAFEEVARARFPHHVFEGRSHEIRDGRSIGWFRGRKA